MIRRCWLVGGPENPFPAISGKNPLTQPNGFGIRVAVNACAGFFPCGVGIKRRKVEVYKRIGFYILTGIIKSGKKDLAGRDGENAAITANTQGGLTKPQVGTRFFPFSRGFFPADPVFLQH